MKQCLYQIFDSTFTVNDETYRDMVVNDRMEFVNQIQTVEDSLHSLYTLGKCLRPFSSYM